MSEAGLYTARGVYELGEMVTNLAEQGFRIIAVIDTQNGDYHVVAQKEITYETRLSEENITVITHDKEGENVKFVSPPAICPECKEKLVMNGSQFECRTFTCIRWRGY